MKSFVPSLILLLTLLLPALTYGQDIVVLDADGLTRVHVSSKTAITIEIKTECNLLSLTPLEVVLLREDGLGDEIAAIDHGACVYVAHGISSGKWRIKAKIDASKIPVINVSVINPMNAS